MSVLDNQQSFRNDMDQLDLMIEQLRREYDMFFAGVLKRPPLELKNRVEALFRRNRANNIHKLELTFRFQGLQSKYVKYLELIDKIIKRREDDPHARSAYGPSREQLAKEMQSLNRGRSELERQARVRAARAPEDKMRELFNSYVDAKKEMGESVDSLRYDSFSSQIRKQQDRIKQKTGADDVAFSVVRKGGKVSLTAKPKKDE